MSVVIAEMSRVATMTTLQGSIGSGKSLLLNALRKYIEEHNLCVLSAPAIGQDRDLYMLIDEPVADWCIKNCSLLNCKGEGDDETVYSYLELFYKGMTGEYANKPNPWAYDFQTNTFTTRFEHLKTEVARIPLFSEESNTRVHLIAERSLRTDRLFFKNVYESGQVAQHQWMNYERFHRTFCEATMEREDVMVYLNTSAKKCYERIHLKRKRDAEVKSSIPLEYLESLEAAHKEMIEEFAEKKGADRLIHVNFEQDMNEEEIAAFTAELMQKLKAITQ